MPHRTRQPAGSGFKKWIMWLLTEPTRSCQVIRLPYGVRYGQREVAVFLVRIAVEAKARVALNQGHRLSETSNSCVCVFRVCNCEATPAYARLPLVLLILHFSKIVVSLGFVRFAQFLF